MRLQIGSAILQKHLWGLLGAHLLQQLLSLTRKWLQSLHMRQGWLQQLLRHTHPFNPTHPIQMHSLLPQQPCRHSQPKVGLMQSQRFHQAQRAHLHPREGLSQLQGYLETQGASRKLGRKLGWPGSWTLQLPCGSSRMLSMLQVCFDCNECCLAMLAVAHRAHQRRRIRVVTHGAAQAAPGDLGHGPSPRLVVMIPMGTAAASSRATDAWWRVPLRKG